MCVRGVPAGVRRAREAWREGAVRLRGAREARCGRVWMRVRGVPAREACREGAARLPREIARRARGIRKNGRRVDLEKEPVLVLVTMQHACARLIREGVDLALREGRPVKVLHVVNPDAAPIGEPAINAQALDYLYALSGEAGAEMCVLTSNVPVTAIANYAADCGARHVIMGGGGQACGIAETLSQLLPGVRVMILERE